MQPPVVRREAELEIHHHCVHIAASLSRWVFSAASPVLLAALVGLASCAHGPPPPAGTVAMSLEEARIAAAARTALINDPQLGLRAITVDVTQRVVTLRGVVRSQIEADLAARLVRTIDGVADVRSALRVQP